DIQNSGRSMRVGIAFGKCDAAVDDDGTVPVPSFALEHRNLPSRFGLVHAQSSVGIVYVEQTARDNGTRTAVSVTPHRPQSTTTESPRRSRAAIGGEKPRRRTMH